MKPPEIVIQTAGRRHTVVFLSLNLALLDGKEYRFDARMLTADRMSLIVGNSLFRVYFATSDPMNSPGELEVTVRGRTIRLHPEDRRAELLESIAKSKPVRTDEISVLAPMPGLVSRILVSPGTRMGAGAGVLILEAMKMENEIRSSSSGIVKELKVIPGQTVEKNQLLAIISVDA